MLTTIPVLPKKLTHKYKAACGYSLYNNLDVEWILPKAARHKDSVFKIIKRRRSSVVEKVLERLVTLFVLYFEAVICCDYRKDIKRGNQLKQRNKKAFETIITTSTVTQ